MLEERDCLFPSLDLCLPLFHGNPRVLMEPRGTFLGTLTTFFVPLKQWTIGGGKGTQKKGTSSTFQSWNISVVDVLDSRHVSCVDLDMPASLWIERRALSPSCLTCSSKYILFFGAYELNSWIFVNHSCVDVHTVILYTEIKKEVFIK